MSKKIAIAILISIIAGYWIFASPIRSFLNTIDSFLHESYQSPAQKGEKSAVIFYLYDCLKRKIGEESPSMRAFFLSPTPADDFSGQFEKSLGIPERSIPSLLKRHPVKGVCEALSQYFNTVKEGTAHSFYDFMSQYAFEPEKREAFRGRHRRDQLADEERLPIEQTEEEEKLTLLGPKIFPEEKESLHSDRKAADVPPSQKTGSHHPEKEDPAADEWTEEGELPPETEEIEEPLENEEQSGTEEENL